MRIRALPALAVIALSLLSDGAFCDELADRAAIEREAVTLLAGERFSSLEDLAAKYRGSRSRTSSGLWHLTLFYAGISSAFRGNHKDEQFWVRADRLVQKWIAAYPDSAAARLAYANLLISHGWSYRGQGYAHTVEPQNWKPFHDYVEKARAYLEENKNAASRDPHWYELMAVIAYVQGWPESEFTKLIAEALEREPQFYQTYFAAIDYYTPKWRGSAEAIERFAREALEKTRSTEGFGMYARIYWYASQTQYDSRLFSESLVDWATMKKGIDDVLAKYPDSWNINNFARFACLSRDKAKTAELIGRINEGPLMAVWGTPSFFERCKAWASS